MKNNSLNTHEVLSSTASLPLRQASSTIDFAVGGQAVMEGVMMRSPNFITIAVRKPDGFITQKDEIFRSLSMRLKFFGIPLVRGVVNLFEMMIIGMRMLNFSAGVALENQQENSESSANPAKGASLASSEISAQKSSGLKTFLGALSLGLSMVFALAVSLFLFKFLPLWITDFLSKSMPVLNQNYLIYNLVDGVIKMSFFIIYIWLLGLTPSMHRVFQYHGAEHKSIYTYEKGLDLTVENAKKMTRFHPRCGTSFVLVVFMISIFIYTFVPRQPDFYLNFALRVAFLPLVAGASYEILKWSAKHAEQRFVRLITLPGLLFQRITTQEPDETQLEVALTALRKALELEQLRLVNTEPISNFTVPDVH